MNKTKDTNEPLATAGFPLVIDDYSGLCYLSFGGPNEPEHLCVDIPSKDIWKLRDLIARIDPRSLAVARKS